MSAEGKKSSKINGVGVNQQKKDTGDTGTGGGDDEVVVDDKDNIVINDGE